jgi:hypothetical protein
MDLLTTEEITEAADLFFKSFNIIDKAMPKGSSIEDTLKVSDHVIKIASKLRQDREKEARDERFGFGKTKKLE